MPGAVLGAHLPCLTSFSQQFSETSTGPLIYGAATTADMVATRHMLPALMKAAFTKDTTETQRKMPRADARQL